MIAFDLVCSNGHKFECWFKNNESFEDQKSCGVITCPVCDNNQVEKALSTFWVKRQTGKKEQKIDPSQILQLFYDYIDKNFEDVGLDFTKEALKIHYKEAKKRNIKGITLPDQEKILEEEGVPFFKIPIMKRLDN